jgi:hypothetical protein
MTKKQKSKANTWIKKLREQQQYLQDCVTLAEGSVTFMQDLICGMEALVDESKDLAAVSDVMNAFEETTNTLDALKLEATAVDIRIEKLQPFIVELEKQELREKGL